MSTTKESDASNSHSANVETDGNENFEQQGRIHTADWIELSGCKVGNYYC